MADRLDFSGVFEPELLQVLRATLDEAWREAQDRRAFDVAASDARARTVLAKRLLARARQGERDPARLKLYALNGLAAKTAPLAKSRGGVSV